MNLAPTAVLHGNAAQEAADTACIRGEKGFGALRVHLNFSAAPTEVGHVTQARVSSARIGPGVHHAAGNSLDADRTGRHPVLSTDADGAGGRATGRLDLHSFPRCSDTDRMPNRHPDFLPTS